MVLQPGYGIDKMHYNSYEKKEKYLIRDYFLIFYALQLVAFTTIISHEPFALFIGLFALSFLHIYYVGLKIDIFFVLVFLVWFIINLFSSYFHETSFSLNSTLGYFIRISISYLILKIVGITFWPKFEKMVFILSVVSTSIYLIDLFFLKSFFIALRGIFEIVTAEIFIKKHTYHWSAFIYTHAYKSSAHTEIVDFRNAGFMWEPGAFAMLLTIVILYNLFKTEFILNKRIIIYSVILLGTFSTAGYVSFALLLMIYFIRTKKIFYGTLVFLVLLFSVPIIIQYDFLGGKIDSYLTQNVQGTMGYQKDLGIYEVNRYTAFLLKSYQWSNYPLGYGVTADEKIKGVVNIVDGVNGLGDILYRWGIIGILFLIVSLINFFRFISPKSESVTILFLSLSPILVVFFSNPIQLNPIVFFLVFTPFIYKKSTTRVSN